MTCAFQIALMLGAGCVGLAWFIFKAATYEPTKPARIDLSDKSTWRREKSDTGALGNFVGLIVTALAVTYALNYPICG